MIAALVSLVAYCICLRRYAARYPAKSVPLCRAVAFSLACAIGALALSPVIDDRSDASFTWHMAQHLALVFIAVPLALAGEPLVLILGLAPRSVAKTLGRAVRSRAARAAAWPAFTLAVFTAVLWGTHFSALYDAALRFPIIHAFEHSLFLAAALLFWLPVVQTGVTIRAVPFGARLLYLALALPQGAFLGLALYSSRTPLYASYVARSSESAALADQHDGGALMWIAGGALLFIAFMLTVAAWAHHEREPAGEPASA